MIKGGRNMKLVLSCIRCGATDFKNTKHASYLLQEDCEEAKVICDKCGLEDYVKCLVITFK